MKRKIIALIAVLALMSGGLWAFIRSPQEKRPVPGAASDRGIFEASPEEKNQAAGAPSVRQTETDETWQFRSVEGEPFSRSDLEGIKPASSGTVSEKSGPAVFDLGTIHPVVKKTAEQARELVGELDRKTLDATTKVLEKIPLVDIRPDKAELRPSGDGLKLTLTMDPEDIRFGKKQQTAPEGKITSEDITAKED
ncbi:MAG: hypothetical protein Q7I97_09485 [Thermovirgaceae bacterium]|nr:hypothetical protein [Thermovirgaceae bacterium]